MNEEKKKNNWLTIVGGVALILVLFLTVKLIFAGLEKALPPRTSDLVPPAASSQRETVDQSRQEQAPAFCPFCGKEMTDSFQWGQFCPWCGKKVDQ